MSLLAEKTANLSSAERMFEEELTEILRGLRAPQKRISPKYFYDQRGSELFDAICELPEYYPTRTEQRIMSAHLPEIAELVGPGASVIEFGAGSNAKARQLLEQLDAPVAYVPVEISGEYLAEQADELAREFPTLSVIPVVADFTKPFDLPRHPVAPNRNLIFFPGSTIGNFTRSDARNLLEVMRAEAKGDGALLVGVDLVKEIDVIESAYNDSRGVTAEFNLNVLRHLNTGLGADFDAALFRHEAVYDPGHNRIEMRLVAERPHTVHIGGHAIDFARDEYIITEYSHKYSVEDFTALAAHAGLTAEAVWLDDDALFSVHYLTVQ
jgi:L-histidine Nalpha-methyltransferase